jgi:predicted PurR-regulated permease PerM
MLRTAKNNRAISAVLSVLLLIIITVAAGIILFNFVIGMLENIAKSDSVQLFSLYISIVNINETCMTIQIGNRLNHDVYVERVYINNEPREIINVGSRSISSNSIGALFVKGPYAAGGSYDIKLVFDSGQSIISVARY